MTTARSTTFDIDQPVEATAANPRRIAVRCCDCPAEVQSNPAKDGSAKTPMRWRKIEGGFRCPKCQKGQFMGRSIRLRINGPHESETRDKAEMYRALNAASKESNQFGNWYLQQLLAADVLQTQGIVGFAKTAKGTAKIPPAPQVDYYAAATKLFPHIAPSSLVQQARMVASYYAKERFSALVAMRRNVRGYVWDGLPVVVSAQAWKLVRLEDNLIVLRAQIGPGKSWTLRVFAEGENLQRMRQIAAGEVLPGAAMFVRRARGQRPGETKRVRVWYLRISAQVPRPKKTRGPSLKEKTLTLGHDKESLLYGSPDEGDDVFEYPAPTLRSLIAAHKKLDRQRQIENSFRVQISRQRGSVSVPPPRRGEQWSKRKALRWCAARTAACERNRNKVKAEIAMCAASLTNWCVAHNITAVDYDVTPRGWMESFPYYALTERIKVSLENAGIAVHLHGKSSTGNAIDIGGPDEEREAAE